MESARHRFALTCIYPRAFRRIHFVAGYICVWKESRESVSPESALNDLDIYFWVHVQIFNSRDSHTLHCAYTYTYYNLYILYIQFNNYIIYIQSVSSNMLILYFSFGNEYPKYSDFWNFKSNITQRASFQIPRLFMLLKKYSASMPTSFFFFKLWGSLFFLILLLYWRT